MKTFTLKYILHFTNIQFPQKQFSIIKLHQVMITVLGIFENYDAAEDASFYLLGNDFESEHVDIHTVEDKARAVEFFNHLFDDKEEAAAHAEAALHNTVITVHALSIREAQEAADVLNNYGAIDMTIPGSENTISRIVERAVNSSVRLK